MHVVVTGAAGFIGSHTVQRLASAGHRVTGIDAFDGYLYAADHKRANAGLLEGVPGFRLVEGDICDATAVESVITSDVDVVCHLAALAGVRPSIADPQRYLRTNILGTGVITTRMRDLGRSRLVFASSSSVYGARLDGGDGFREDDACVRPASPYAATKRMNELQLSAERDIVGLGVYALRFFTVFGPRQRPDMAIARFLRAAVRGETITMFGDGSSRRDYTFIDDIVSGVVAAVERVSPGAYEIINLGGTHTTTLHDLIEIIQRVTSTQLRIERKGDQPGDVPLTFANIDKARRLLDFAPTTAVEEGIARQFAALTPRPIP
ncbi:MAG TPA: NAD-dependent epimerase/dehydratase family protein [Kofleriaceae bacterium]|jgi:UDP-glucuronate 4-epimerase